MSAPPTPVFAFNAPFRLQSAHPSEFTIRLYNVLPSKNISHDSHVTRGFSPKSSIGVVAKVADNAVKIKWAYIYRDFGHRFNGNETAGIPRKSQANWLEFSLAEPHCKHSPHEARFKVIEGIQVASTIKAALEYKFPSD